MAYVRTVKTASGATAVQIVWSSRRGSRSIEHLGSAHDEAELAALKAAAAERLAAGQAVLDLGVAGAARIGAVADHVARRSTHLWDGLCARLPGAGVRCRHSSGDEVFRDLVLARIIEPTSKVDAERVLERDRRRAGVLSPPSSGACRVCAKPSWRQALSAACAARPAGAGIAGALRRVHAVLRNRCR